MTLSRVTLTATLSLALVAGTQAQTVNPTFAGSYTLTNIGTPSGVATSFGGLTLKAGDNNTLLLGGAAAKAAGRIYEVPLTRDGSNHITAVGTAGTSYAAPSIDGGLAYGPGGVLFAAAFNDTDAVSQTNQIYQYKPGSTTIDKTIKLNTIGIPNQTGGIQFTPSGTAVTINFTTGTHHSVTLTADGLGTYTDTAGEFTRRPAPRILASQNGSHE